VWTLCTYVLMRAATLTARLLIRLRVTGQGRIPRVAPFIICPNHQSYLDAFLVVGALPYRTFKRLFFVGASEYFATPFTAKMAGLMKVVPVDPDANLVRAMQAGALGLRSDRILMLFPEGERSPDGAPRKFKKGAAILAHHLGVPIVPVALEGLETVWPRGAGPRWRQLLPWSATRTAIEFGEPIVPESGAGAPGDDRYTHLTGALRQAVMTMWEKLNARPR
jgi:long-chain acyl-CoA synthetase